MDRKGDGFNTLSIDALEYVQTNALFDIQGNIFLKKQPDS